MKFPTHYNVHLNPFTIPLKIPQAMIAYYNKIVHFFIISWQNHNTRKKLLL